MPNEPLALPETNAIAPVGQRISLPDADLTFYPDFFTASESDDLFQQLHQAIDWQQEQITLYGRTINLPRKTAWYGDRGKFYTFSGIRLQPEPWTPTLRQIQARIEAIAPVSFNSVLLNLYRDGSDSIAWHTDAEPELGAEPVIASVSLGGTRRFQFRHRFERSLKAEIALTPGSVLLMAGPTQRYWQHQVPKTTKAVAPRINLTFRVIVQEGDGEGEGTPRSAGNCRP